jgi:hypothetical protein
MRVAKSTSFLCSVFPDPLSFFEAALTASSVSLSALRIFILMWTGSASFHLFGSHERVCRLCGEILDSRHYFGCTFDICQHLQLIVMARRKRFPDLVCFTMNRFFAFLWRSKPTILSEEEAFIYELSESPDQFMSLVRRP